MTSEKSTQDQQDEKAGQPAPAAQSAPEAFDGLANKKPEDLTPEELRLMADTMPGDGPGD